MTSSAMFSFLPFSPSSVVPEPERVLDERPDGHGTVELELGDVVDAVLRRVAAVRDLKGVPALGRRVGGLVPGTTIVQFNAIRRLIYALPWAVVVDRRGVRGRRLVVEQLQLVVVGAHAAVDAAADEEDARLVHGEADGIGGAVAGVPSAAVGRAGEPEKPDSFSAQNMNFKVLTR